MAKKRAYAKSCYGIMEQLKNESSDEGTNDIRVPRRQIGHGIRIFSEHRNNEDILEQVLIIL